MPLAFRSSKSLPRMIALSPRMEGRTLTVAEACGETLAPPPGVTPDPLAQFTELPTGASAETAKR
jgi:hypothetical protein